MANKILDFLDIYSSTIENVTAEIQKETLEESFQGFIFVFPLLRFQLWGFMTKAILYIIPFF